MDDKSKRPHLVLPKLPPRSNTVSSGSSNNNNNNNERPQPPIVLPRVPTRAGPSISSIPKEKRNSMSGGAPVSPNRVLPPILPEKPKLKPTGFDTSEGANNDVTSKLERKFSDIPQSTRVETIQKQSSENVLSRSTELNLSNLETILSEKKKILAQKSISTPTSDDQREKEEIGEKITIRKKERISKSKSKDEDSTQKRHRRTLSSGESALFSVNKPSANAIISQMQKMKIKTDIEVPLDTPKSDNNNNNNNHNNNNNAPSVAFKEKESKEKEKEKEKVSERELREREDKSRGLVTSLGGGVMDIVKQGASMPGHAASEISKKTSRFASKIMGAVSTNNPSSSPDQNARTSPFYYYGSKTVEELLSGDDLLQSKEIATSFLLTQLLELIGLNENQSQEVFEKIMQFIPNECISSYTNREISNLTNIINGSQKIVKKHSEAKHIVKIQSLCRGFLLRRRVKNIVSGDIKGRVQFNRTFALFIEREEHYIKNLKLLIDRFLTPVRAKISAGREIIKLEDMSFIFCNVEIILEIHQKNLRRLKALLDDWPFIKGVGKAILEIGSSLQAYGIYVGNFKNAQDTVIRLKAEKNSKFNGWVQEVAQKHQDGYDLLTLISLPVNHIAKMEPLLEQLASLAVGYDQIEVENLNNASSMIRETSKFVTQNLLHSDNTAVITNVQRRITGYFKPLNLIKPDRKFMMETQFTTLADKKKIYLFLFNDILLVTIPQKNLFKFKDIVLLDLVQFEDMKSEKNAFILKTPNEILKLVAKTSEDKQQWVKILSSLEESRKVNRTIGVGIQEILDRESSQSPRDGAKKIPSILTQCIEHIERNDGINTEGLFRISGDQREVNSLVDLFDTMVESERDLASFSIHSVCSVLKLWFRELPEPLLTFSFYDKLVDIERKTSDDDDRGITQYRETILTLPKSNICSLRYLLDFLGKVCQNSNVNKMTTNNMAIVFGPTLLRPLTETIETTLNSPIINRIVQIFIEKFDELFE